MQVQTPVYFCSLLIGLPLLAGCGSTAGRHSSIFKSIRSTDDECRWYFNERNGNCSVRCRGLLNRFWDDQRGKLGHYALKQFYQPDPEDKCYLNRTMRCLKQVPVSDESCQRVTQYVRCYKDQYGKENTATARFIPFTPIQQTRILMECAAILGISEDSLREAAKNGGEIPQEACLLRCFLIRQGLYSEAGGFELERLELQCGGYGSGWNPVAIQQCIANVTDCDSCTKVHRMAKTCLQVHFKVLPSPDSNVDAVVVEFYSVALMIFDEELISVLLKGRLPEDLSNYKPSDFDIRIEFTEDDLRENEARQILKEVQKFIEKTNFDNVSLIGHSLGGHVAG